MYRIARILRTNTEINGLDIDLLALNELTHDTFLNRRGIIYMMFFVPLNRFDYKMTPFVTDTLARKPYVGSTYGTACARYMEHLADARRGDTSTLHRSMRNAPGEHFTMVPIATVNGTFTNHADFQKVALPIEASFIRICKTLAPRGLNDSSPSQAELAYDPRARRVQEAQENERSPLPPARGQAHLPMQMRKNQDILIAARVTQRGPSDASTQEASSITTSPTSHGASRPRRTRTGASTRSTHSPTSGTTPWRSSPPCSSGSKPVRRRDCATTQ